MVARAPLTTFRVSLTAGSTESERSDASLFLHAAMYNVKVPMKKHLMAIKKCSTSQAANTLRVSYLREVRDNKIVLKTHKNNRAVETFLDSFDRFRVQSVKDLASAFLPFNRVVTSHITLVSVLGATAACVFLANMCLIRKKVLKQKEGEASLAKEEEVSRADFDERRLELINSKALAHADDDEDIPAAAAAAVPNNNAAAARNNNAMDLRG